MSEIILEVDPSALQDAIIADADNQQAEQASQEAQELSPEEMLAALPSSLQEHIQEKIAQADADGYLRGRNEVIAETQPFEDPEPLPTFPIYNRRSIWDS